MIPTLPLFPLDESATVSRSAVISDDGVYRYRLDRWWGPESAGMGSTRMPFIMLNPSKADADRDDPTIGRCMGFARREGYLGITVVNLYSYRATDPAELASALAAGVPILGRGNYDYVLDVAETAGYVVAAWGAHPYAQTQGNRLTTVLRDNGISIQCLGTTKDGSPRHPLYVRGDQPLEPYRRHV